MRRDKTYLAWARTNRSEQNGAEDRMWYLLRAHRFQGYKFRRQHKIGPFIVDFVCLSSKLIIEVDGDTHGNDEAERSDARRQNWLERQGFQVLRFDNGYIYEEPGGVWEMIDEVISGRMKPSDYSPSP